MKIRQFIYFRSYAAIIIGIDITLTSFKLTHHVSQPKMIVLKFVFLSDSYVDVFEWKSHFVCRHSTFHSKIFMSISIFISTYFLLLNKIIDSTTKIAV
jgi:hypothetical protein